MHVSFVIPALNEERSIGTVLEEVRGAQARLAAMGHGSDVTVVDGGSADKTAEIVEAAGARVLRCGKGYGRQYKAGIAAAGGDVIVTGDSDCTYPFCDAPDLVSMLIAGGHDFISTDRFPGLEDRSMSVSHFVGNKLLTMVANGLFGLSLKDSQSGMWVFRRDLVPRLSLKDDDMAFSQEIKIDAARAGRFAQVGIRYRPRVGEKKLRTFVHGYRNLRHLFAKRFFS